MNNDTSETHLQDEVDRFYHENYEELLAKLTRSARVKLWLAGSRCQESAEQIAADALSWAWERVDPTAAEVPVTFCLAYARRRLRDTIRVHTRRTRETTNCPPGNMGTRDN